MSNKKNELKLMKKHESARLSGSDEHESRVKGAGGMVLNAIGTYAGKAGLDSTQEEVYDALKSMRSGGFGVSSGGGVSVLGADLEGTGTFSAEISESGNIDVTYTDFTAQPPTEKKAAYPTGVPLSEMLESAPETHGQVYGQLLLEYSEHMATPEDKRAVAELGLELAQRPDITVGGGAGAGGQKRIIAAKDTEYIQIDFKPGGISVERSGSPKAEYKFRAVEE